MISFSDFGDGLLLVITHLHDGMSLLLGWIVVLLYRLNRNMFGIMEEHSRNEAVLLGMIQEISAQQKTIQSRQALDLPAKEG
jgi:hypothetical protein